MPSDGQEWRNVVWSFSRLTAFETCPRRHYEVDLAKNYVDSKGAEAEFGDKLHKALEAYGKEGTPLPPELRGYQKVADRVVALKDRMDLKFEQKLALNSNFEPTDFFADDVWFRCIVDVLGITGSRIAAVIDYKTGKIKPKPEQLELNAATIFAYYPEVNRIDARFWWITKGSADKGTEFSNYVYHRDDLPATWAKFLPRLRNYGRAIAEQRFFPNPSGLCHRYCPVKSCTFCGAK